MWSGGIRRCGMGLLLVIGLAWPALGDVRVTGFHLLRLDEQVDSVTGAPYFSSTEVQQLFVGDTFTVTADVVNDGPDMVSVVVEYRAQMDGPVTEFVRQDLVYAAVYSVGLGVGETQQLSAATTAGPVAWHAVGPGVLTLHATVRLDDHENSQTVELPTVERKFYVIDRNAPLAGLCPLTGGGALAATLTATLVAGRRRWRA